jgi:hypothetical protein
VNVRGVGDMGAKMLLTSVKGVGIHAIIAEQLAFANATNAPASLTLSYTVRSAEQK